MIWHWAILDNEFTDYLVHLAILTFGDRKMLENGTVRIAHDPTLKKAIGSIEQRRLTLLNDFKLKYNRDLTEINRSVNTGNKSFNRET